MREASLERHVPGEPEYCIRNAEMRPASWGTGRWKVRMGLVCRRPVWLAGEEQGREELR